MNRVAALQQLLAGNAMVLKTIIFSTLQIRIYGNTEANIK